VALGGPKLQCIRNYNTFSIFICSLFQSMKDTGRRYVTYACNIYMFLLQNTLFSLCTSNLQRESKNCATLHSFITFDKCWPIFKILSLLYSAINLQQIPCHITHHILDVSLHYLAKDKKPKFTKFCCS